MHQLLSFFYVGLVLCFYTKPSGASSGAVSKEIEFSGISGNQSGNAAKVLRRGKRYLDFLDTSRLFFRINVKNNIIPLPTIWAHGYGFRVNIPIETDHHHFRPYKRDTYEVLRDLMEHTGFDGEACILKAFCTAHMELEQTITPGILLKLFRHIFTLDAHDKHHFPYLRMENCQQILHSHCPLSFNNISPYTDDA